MIQVYTGDNWLMHAFNGYRNEQDTARIEIIFDKYDRPIIGTSITNDPTWNMQLPVTNPHTNETRPLIEWLELIDYEPKEITEDNGTI
jgi:hypothetical protein